MAAAFLIRDCEGNAELNSVRNTSITLFCLADGDFQEHLLSYYRDLNILQVCDCVFHSDIFSIKHFNIQEVGSEDTQDIQSRITALII